MQIIACHANRNSNYTYKNKSVFVSGLTDAKALNRLLDSHFRKGDSFGDQPKVVVAKAGGFGCPKANRSPKILPLKK